MSEDGTLLGAWPAHAKLFKASLLVIRKSPESDMCESVYKKYTFSHLFVAVALYARHALRQIVLPPLVWHALAGGV